MRDPRLTGKSIGRLELNSGLHDVARRSLVGGDRSTPGALAPAHHPGLTTQTDILTKLGWRPASRPSGGWHAAPRTEQSLPDKPHHDSSRGVAAQLPRNLRATTKATTDLPHPHTLRTEDSDVFPFGKRQITPRHRTQRDRWHPTSLAEPSRPNRRRHPRPGTASSLETPPDDRLPEPDGDPLRRAFDGRPGDHN